MAINILSLAWFDRLRRAGILRGSSILDLGPQDLVMCPRKAVEFYVARWSPPEAIARTMAELFDGDAYRGVGATAIYRLFGLGKHVASDLYDARATLHVDLNAPAPPGERFNVVTNFGTVEHVFDIATAFRFIHDALEPDGLALHVLPTFGELNHGFYNIHPTTFFDLAAANGYALEHYAYVDNIDLRCALQMRQPDTVFDFDALPIAAVDLMRPDLLRRVVNQYAAMSSTYRVLMNGQETTAPPKDYSYVALRKVRDAPFVKPTQRAYGLTKDGRFAVSSY